MVSFGLDKELHTAWQRAWEMPDRRPIYEWARENVILPNDYNQPGPFNIDSSRYLVRPFDLMQKDEVRQININKAVRTGGTLLNDIFVQWISANSPGPTLIALQTDDEATAHWSTRIEPAFRISPANKKLYYKSKKQRDLVRFPHMSLYVSGANISSFQRKGIKYLLNSELWQWRPGLLEQAKGRVEDFKFVCKIVNESQAGAEYSKDWRTEWESGRIEVISLRCPKCKENHPFNFFAHMHDDPKKPAGIVWEKKVRADGSRCPDTARHTARYKCPHCGEEFSDSPGTWAMMNRNLDYICTTPDRSERNVSLKWNSLVAGGYGELAEKYIEAMNSRDAGSLEKLKAFHEKNLVDFWEEDMGQDKIELNSGNYSIEDPWDRTDKEFITVDYQEGSGDQSEHFWLCHRAWAVDGASRLMCYMRLDTHEEIRMYQQKFGVLDTCVILDGGHKLTYIATICSKYGWTIFEGSDRISFPHYEKGTKDPIQKPYSKARSIDPNKGKRGAGRVLVKSFLWSNPTVKELTFRLRHGLGLKWETPDTVSGSADKSFDLSSYKKQIDSEIKQDFTHPKTGEVKRIWKRIKKDNHAWDCECMQTVVALICGLLTAALDGETAAVAEQQAAEAAKKVRESKPRQPAPYEQPEQIQMFET